jgi:hypothetical protein
LQKEQFLDGQIKRVVVKARQDWWNTYNGFHLFVISGYDFSRAREMGWGVCAMFLKPSPSLYAT